MVVILLSPMSVSAVGLLLVWQRPCRVSDSLCSLSPPGAPPSAKCVGVVLLRAEGLASHPRVRCRSAIPLAQPDSRTFKKSACDFQGCLIGHAFRTRGEMQIRRLCADHGKKEEGGWLERCIPWCWSVLSTDRAADPQTVAALDHTPYSLGRRPRALHHVFPAQSSRYLEGLGRWKPRGGRTGDRRMTAGGTRRGKRSTLR